MSELLILYGLIGLIAGAITFVMATEDRAADGEFTPLEVAVLAGALWPAYLFLLLVEGDEVEDE